MNCRVTALYLRPKGAEFYGEIDKKAALRGFLRLSYQSKAKVRLRLNAKTSFDPSYFDHPISEYLDRQMRPTMRL